MTETEKRYLVLCRLLMKFRVLLLRCWLISGLSGFLVGVLFQGLICRQLIQDALQIRLTVRI